MVEAMEVPGCRVGWCYVWRDGVGVGAAPPAPGPAAPGMAVDRWRPADPPSPGRPVRPDGEVHRLRRANAACPRRVRATLASAPTVLRPTAGRARAASGSDAGRRARRRGVAQGPEPRHPRGRPRAAAAPRPPVRALGPGRSDPGRGRADTWGSRSWPGDRPSAVTRGSRWGGAERSAGRPVDDVLRSSYGSGRGALADPLQRTALDACPRSRATARRALARAPPARPIRRSPRAHGASPKHAAWPGAARTPRRGSRELRDIGGGRALGGADAARTASLARCSTALLRRRGRARRRRRARGADRAVKRRAARGPDRPPEARRAPIPWPRRLRVPAPPRPPRARSTRHDEEPARRGRIGAAGASSRRSLARRRRWRGAVVMDERTASLDLGNRPRALDRVRRPAARGLGPVVATRDPGQGVAHAHRVAILAGGRLAALGPPADVVAAEAPSAACGAAATPQRTDRGRRVSGGPVDAGRRGDRAPPSPQSLRPRLGKLRLHRRPEAVLGGSRDALHATPAPDGPCVSYGSVCALCDAAGARSGPLWNG